MNIHTLLRAAEYIEKKDRADEHGYACILPPSPPPLPSLKFIQRHHIKPSKSRRKKNVKLKRSSSSKESSSSEEESAVQQERGLICGGSHNELEKNRRAHLRECLDQLKKVVPLSPESSRHTTLGLLINTVNLIKSLEESSKQHEVTLSMLDREKQYLLWNINQHKRSRYRSTGHHTVSESSSSGSLDGSPFGSENDDVDIMGCPSPSSTSSLCTTPVQSDSGSISPVSVAMTTINQSFNSLL